MKIVYILGYYPKISETFVLNEMLEVQRQGYEVEVFAHKKANELIVHPGTQKIEKVYYFKSLNLLNLVMSHFQWLFKAPKYYLKALGIFLVSDLNFKKVFAVRLMDIQSIVKSKPDHLHAHFGDYAADVAMLTHILTGIPYTFTTHRYDIFDKPASNYAIKSSLALKHVTISNFNKDYIVSKFGVSPNDIEVIHCGIDFSKISKITHSGSDENLIVSIARLEKVKALENLIQACNFLNKQEIDFECQIIGEGSERENLEKLIGELHLENQIKLLGAKEQTEVFEILSRSKVLVLPSRSEGIPVSLMEAMALRVCVIGPDVNGVSELIEDGVNGFLVKPDDIEELTKKISLLLRDSDLRNKFMINAFERVKENFNLEIEVSKLISIWKKSA